MTKQHTYNSIQFNQLQVVLERLCVSVDLQRKEYLELSKNIDGLLERFNKGALSRGRIVTEEKSGRNETPEYQVWYNDSEPSGFLLDLKTKEEIVTTERDQYNLFIIREDAIAHIFINGDNAESRPSKLGYRILTLALKHRGNCGTAWNIAKHLYDMKEAEKFKDLREMVKVAKEQLKLNVAIEEFKMKPGDNVEYYSNRVRRLLCTLNQGFLDLNKLGTTIKANDMGELEINPTIKYCLIEKI